MGCVALSNQGSSTETIDVAMSTAELDSGKQADVAMSTAVVVGVAPAAAKEEACENACAAPELEGSNSKVEAANDAAAKKNIGPMNARPAAAPQHAELHASASAAPEKEVVLSASYQVSNADSDATYSSPMKELTRRPTATSIDSEASTRASTASTRASTTTASTNSTPSANNKEWTPPLRMPSSTNGAARHVRTNSQERAASNGMRNISSHDSLSSHKSHGSSSRHHSHDSRSQQHSSNRHCGGMRCEHPPLGGARDQQNSWHPNNGFGGGAQFQQEDPRDKIPMYHNWDGLMLFTGYSMTGKPLTLSEATW